MQLIPRLEKIHSSRDSVRKARESHLIDKAMTLEPMALPAVWRTILIYILVIVFSSLVFFFCVLYVISDAPF